MLCWEIKQVQVGKRKNDRVFETMKQINELKGSVILLGTRSYKRTTS